FIILIFALYAIAGGILVTGNIHGAPGTNTAILAIGAILASCVGTTGASMILIRPIIRANDDRVHNVHVVVFFIFIVSNCGGALTPLGD
ncbi:sodium:proton antiporter, partial [Acinetobacter baumannii]